VKRIIEEKVGMMMSETPKVSVIIPVYNAEAYLRQCLDSVVNQTLQDIEIICVDNGSTDSSLKILEEYKYADSRVNVLTQKKQYVSVARNNGMAQAKGYYLIFLDACNWLEINALELMFVTAEENGVDIVICSENIYDDILNKSVLVLTQNTPRGVPFSWQDFSNGIFNCAAVNTEIRFYRTAFLHENNLLYPPFQADTDIYYSLYAMVLAKKIFLLNNDNALVHHYVINNIEDEKETALSFQDNYSLLQSRLIQKGLYEELKRSFINKVLVDGICHIQNIKNEETRRLVKYYFVKEMIFQFDIWDKSKEYFYDTEKYDLLQEYILEFESSTLINKSNVDVSVVVPVYNAEQYIEKCAKSLLAQTLKNIEIIFVDDGSTDNTLEILNDLSVKDERIKVLHQNNLYAGVARNNGLEKSRGEYVIFLDADDFFEKNMLETMYGKAKTYSAEIVLCAANRFDSNTETFLPMPWLLKEEYLPDEGAFNFDNLPDTFFQLTISVPWNKLFKKSFLEKIHIRFQNNRRANDLYFTYTAMSLAERICVVNKIFVHYRVNTGSNLQANNDKDPTNFLRALMGLKYNLIRNNIYDKLKKSFVNAAMTNSMYTLDTVKKSSTATNILSELLTMFYLNEFEILGKPANYFFSEDYYKMLEQYKAKANLSKFIFNLIPKVSVITPVYNAEKYLAECIDSLLAQTLYECEFIFVDDGSTDNSLALLKQYAQRDRRINVYTQKNSYAGVARNNGISHAVGKYITFLDSDDIMLPNALEILYEQAEKTKADIVISSAYRFSNDINKRSVEGSALREKFLPVLNTFSVKNYSKFIFQISSGAPWGKMYNRKFIHEHGIYFPDTPRAEDFFFVGWALAVAKKIKPLKSATVLYRTLSGSGSLEDAKDKYPLAQFDVRQQLWQKLKEIGVYEQVEQSFINNLIQVCVYNMRSFKTGSAFEAVYWELKNKLIDFYNIDINDDDYFYDSGDYQFIKEIYYSDSCADYLFSKLKTAKGSKEYNSLNSKKNSNYINDSNCSKKEADLIRASVSYRIGRFITYIPRKVRGGIRCYKEHGVGYTLGRVKEKFIDLVGGSK